MGKKTEHARVSAGKAGKQQHKPKRLPKEEEFPVYENDEDIPVFDPENMEANITNQKKKKSKKNKHREEVIEEPQEEVEVEQQEESPQEDYDQIEQEIEDEDLAGDDEMGDG